MPLRRAYFALVLLLATGSVAYVTGLPWLAWDAVKSDCDSRHRGRHRQVEAVLRGRPGRPCSLQARATSAHARIEGIEFEIDEVDEATFPYIVDSNSPAFHEPGGLRLFNSAWEETYSSLGDGPLGFGDPTRVELPRPDRPGAVWLESVWLEPATQLLYGWYHFEPADLICQTAPIIGAAISYDYGMSWQDRGPLSSPATASTVTMTTVTSRVVTVISRCSPGAMASTSTSCSQAMPGHRRRRVSASPAA